MRQNPFHEGTSVLLTLPAAMDVALNIFDVRGRLVRSLIRENRPQGPQSVEWNGRDGGGRDVAPGIYFVRLTSGSGYQVCERVTRVR